AARYGRGDEHQGDLQLLVEIRARSGFEIAIEDNGVGMDRTRGSAKGTGQGLALHSTMMAVVGGSLSVESAPGRYTRVLLRLPIERGK
ncbi:MAG: ATP-binding protein, partial [Candidatus Kapaibacterium sp.]